MIKKATKRPLTKTGSTKLTAKRRAVEKAAPVGLSAFSLRLEGLMKDREVSQSELARRVGIKQQSIYYLLTSTKTATPKTRFLTKIAQALGVDPLWLETGKGDPKGGSVVTAKGERIGRRVPILDASVVIGFVQGKPPSANVNEMVADVEGDRAFAFDVVRDKAMDPDIRPGDRLLVVPPVTRPKPGTVCLFSVDGDGVVVRRLRINPDDTVLLIPSNKDFPVMDSRRKKGITIIGEVVEVRRRVI